VVVREKLSKIFEIYFKILSLISFIFILYPLTRFLINILNIFSIPIILLTYTGPSLVMFALLILSFIIGIIPIVPIVLLAVFGYFSVSRSLRNLRSKETSKFRKALSIMYFIAIFETVLTPSFRAIWRISGKAMLYLTYVLVLFILSTISFISIQYYLVDKCIEEMENKQRRARYNIAYICLEVASIIIVTLFIELPLSILMEIVIINIILVVIHTYIIIRLFK